MQRELCLYFQTRIPKELTLWIYQLLSSDNQKVFLALSQLDIFPKATLVPETAGCSDLPGDWKGDQRSQGSDEEECVDGNFHLGGKGHLWREGPNCYNLWARTAPLTGS